MLSLALGDDEIDTIACPTNNFNLPSLPATSQHFGKKNARLLEKRVP